MSPEDELELRNWRYTRGVWCVPLTSGRIAAWAHPMGDFLGVFEDFPSVPKQNNAALPSPKPAPRAASAPDPEALALLEELGLG